MIRAAAAISCPSGMPLIAPTHDDRPSVSRDKLTATSPAGGEPRDRLTKYATARQGVAKAAHSILRGYGYLVPPMVPASNAASLLVMFHSI